ncbi:TetR/AcrR family transcriptional regulator [Cellulosimicrobium sp. TH-20]|uniref:TetR/AcrR family transcriptional regulator n=1 Tax=Cellulosimicrobium sp. TH-20 TaxID=1980001 RepID=UPI001C92FAEC|nr:TetR family transcriptional regulator [Cellulosimicrobium sp. TH-20]
MTRARRDPEGRRRAIVDAAVAVILEVGLGHVTHRKVAERAAVPLGATTQYFASLDDLVLAALGDVAAGSDRELHALESELAASTDVAGVLARYLAVYGSDPARARAQAAFFVGHVENPRVRELTNQWDAGLALVLARHMGEVAVQAVVTYSYGVVLRAARGDAIPDETELAHVLARLVDADPTTERERP